MVRAQLAEQDYRSLDDDSFGKVLRLAVTESRFSPALAEEVERRLAAGQLLPREAATLLFEQPETATGGATGTRRRGAEAGWQPLRRRVLAWLAAEPGHALTVLTLHAQRRYGGGVRWQEEAVGTVQQPRFTAVAALGEHRSPPRAAPSNGWRGNGRWRWWPSSPGCRIRPGMSPARRRWGGRPGYGRSHPGTRR